LPEPSEASPMLQGLSYNYPYEDVSMIC
jgi:hypothetical protein